MLGDRIRKLRKQKKMTLEALAGDKLTKGMLSLIENNKAKPSLESLAYIARQLDVEVTDLLEDVNVQDLQKVLEKVENLYYSQTENQSDLNKEIISLIEPYASKLTQGYEAARLLDIYGRCFYHEKKHGWDELLSQSASIYEQLNLSSRRTSISIFRTLVKFVHRDYEEALAILLNERAVIDKTFTLIDPLSQLDLDYHEAISYFAVGDSTSAIKMMEKAIKYSNEQRIFYRIDDLYRLACVFAILSHEIEKATYYLKKLKQFGEFSEDEQALLFHDLLYIELLISEHEAFEIAQKVIEKYDTNEKKLAPFHPFIFLTKGKILYGFGQYQLAIQQLKKVTIPNYSHHPFDLALFYVKDAYLALSYWHLGKTEQALQTAKLAKEQFAILPDSPYKKIANDAYDLIKMSRIAKE